MPAEGSIYFIEFIEKVNRRGTAFSVFERRGSAFSEFEEAVYWSTEFREFV